MGMIEKTPAGSNWLALQKKLPKKKPETAEKHTRSSLSAFVARKRRKLVHTTDSHPPAVLATTAAQSSNEDHTFMRGAIIKENETSVVYAEDGGGGVDSIPSLRRMVLGAVEHTASQKQPGKYLSLDCEMVGVGLEGAESVLARVSLVNYHGYILLDEIVRPRERVVDYRTEFSGIRPSDMVHAKPFEEVQKKVADLLKDRILVGHAVHNDLKALLLSHSRPQTRDTQILAHKHKVSRGRRPALRHLVQQELGLTIQSGEHSSVTDARATMALFRLHRKTWEKDNRPLPQRQARSRSSSSPTRKRRREESTLDPPDDVGGESDVDSQPRASEMTFESSLPKEKGKTELKESFPGGGRRGVSSGLSTVIKRVRAAKKDSRGTGAAKKPKTKEQWWKDLGSGGSKGSVRLKAR